VDSIRNTLLLWLLGGLALGSAALVGTTYVLTRAQLDRVFDEELRQVALAVHVREDWGQAGKMRIARPGFAFSVRGYDSQGRGYFETLMPSLPADTPRTYDEGFSAVDTREGAWRIFTHVTSEGIVQVGQADAARDAMARELALRILAPMLVLIPLLLLLVAWALRRGLVPLVRVSALVGGRDVSRLDPLPAGNVPRELSPLVEQINGLLKRLAASVGAQRRFLADAAHELRSPISAVALQAQLATRAQSGPARERALEELITGTERTRRLVQQLLDFARLEPGLPTAPFLLVDMTRVVREAVASHAPKADEAGVDLGAETPGSAFVLGVEAELHSLVANLLDNALRYAPRGSLVTARVASVGDTVEVSIVDAGPGIPPDERERVFERFHRLPADKTPGSGLGLAIARSIVEHHAGAIWLEDARPGRSPPGLAAKFALPAVRVSPRVSFASGPGSGSRVTEPRFT
jgi:two-component system OmpR family sensor kinase